MNRILIPGFLLLKAGKLSTKTSEAIISSQCRSRITRTVFFFFFFFFLLLLFCFCFDEEFLAGITRYNKSNGTYGTLI